jgi:long-subunit acyl-CoA synthetase (AMP-forming)
MFSRYINLPEKTAAEFSGEFFKTGDIAARELMGDDGVYFKILGRASMVLLFIDILLKIDE